MRPFVHLRWLPLLAVLGLSMPSYAAFDSTEAAALKELTIQRITPAGNNVPAVGSAAREIVIQFNRPVVPVGQMARTASELPITITPPLNCEWRWLNTSALGCQLSQRDAMKPSTIYKIVVSPGITAEDGETTAKPYTSVFTTERATLRYGALRVWKSPGHPVLRLTFNQPVTKSSVEAHVFLSLPGQQHSERIALQAAPDEQPREEQPFFASLENRVIGLFMPVPGPSDDELTILNGEEARRIWLVEPERTLHGDSRYNLMVEPGLVSALGPEKSVASHTVRTLDTFPDFAFKGVECRNNSGETIRYAPGAAIPNTACDPLAAKSLVFSAPVLRSQVSKFLNFTPRLAMNAEEEAWGGGDDYSMLSYEFEKGREYMIPLPYFLKASKTYQLQTTKPGFFARLWAGLTNLFSDAPRELTDEFGRPLEQAINLAFSTDSRRPNYELPYSSVVLEQQVDSEVPVWVNNLEHYNFSYNLLNTRGPRDKLSYDRKLPFLRDIQFAVPLGLREMLEGRSGAVFGIFSTTPGIVSSWSSSGFRTDTLFGQVTPYDVHVKLGHFRSLVWVTDFASGLPVEGARVAVYEDSIAALEGPRSIRAEAVTNAQGIAYLPGSEMLDPDLTISRGWSGDNDKRLFFSVRKDDMQALVPTLYGFEINNYRAAGMEDFSTSAEKKYGHMRSWGTTAQGIYRAGDTIDYKLYVRQDDGNHLVAPPPGYYSLTIYDPTNKEVHEVNDITLSEFGAYHGQFTVPKEGAVGWYRFNLHARFEKNADGESRSYDATPITVLISDFTPAPFRVMTELNGDRFEPDQTVAVSTQASLHAGGPYTDAALRVTAILDAMEFRAKSPILQDFSFDSGNSVYIRTAQIHQAMGEIDNKGENRLTFRLNPQSIVYGKLTVESAVEDDRGMNITNRAQADYAGVNRFAGLRNTEWVLSSGEEATLDVAVANAKGEAADDTPVSVIIEKLERKGARVKGAGNAYLTQFETEWNRFASCTIEAKPEPQTCRFTPDSAGSYRAIASVSDTNGRSQQTELRLWASGGDYVLWDDDNTNTLELIPQATDLKVGDTARYLVKNPYPGAQALITVERYGVIDHFTQTLEGSSPIIEIPIKPDYVPGFYVSVGIMAPRVGDKPVGKPGSVDLGKPAFRMGYAGMVVRDPYKEMKVTAATDKETYRPRDIVNLSLHAESKQPGTKEPIELAVVVLDESVFDLIGAGRRYFDPYKGFYSLDGLDVRNFNLITQLIGRQKFEKKGANPGGDGGADFAMRSMFKFVSYWNPSLPVDAKGNATVSFEVPDNLTGWRVLAMAVTPNDRMGLGEGTFKVNRPTEVRPVMPNQVMEGDHFKAGFSVMNRTDKPRDVTVTVMAEGSLNAAGKINSTVHLEPFKRETVWLPLQAGKLPQERDQPEGNITFIADAGDTTDRDGVTHTLPVKKWRSLETAATYGTTIKDSASDSIAFPQDIKPDVGEVSMVLSPSVLGNLAGAFTYLKEYPYFCWEQRLTKAIAATQFGALKSYLPETLTWDKSKTLGADALAQASAFQAPNGGMAFFLAKDEYADPYLSAYTAMGFNWLRNMGQTIPETVEQSLQAYLQRFLKQDVAPSYYNPGMTSTVRAVALAALADQNRITLSDIARYEPHVAKMSLFGKTHYLLAAIKLNAPEQVTRPVVDDILGHASQSGGKVTFNETLDDSYRRLLASPLRENCAILEALTLYGESPQGANVVGDLPIRLVRTITQTRGTRDHWENTQENLFCLNALVTYSRIYESEKPAMQVKVALNNEPMGNAAFNDLRNPSLTFSRAITAQDPGRKATMHLTRKGEGRLYYSTRLSYAPTGEANQPINAGIELRREYSVEREGKWTKLTSPFTIKRGELVLVDLFLSLPTARTYVVVDDPIPGGLEAVNRDLATSSAVDADKGEFKRADDSWYFHFNDWVSYSASRWSFYHQELRHDAARFYADYLPAGNYHLSYTAQAIAEGEFSLLPAKAEEMYDPDIFGKTPSETLKVEGNGK
jgi:uncharacterized protein YfaS (alpha-2-macroglobulin family)